MTRFLPRYPVYVISKGRYERCLTARFLERDGIDFRLVVEPQEFDLYAKAHGRERVLGLPFSNLGLGSIPARNWVWEYAKASGAERHWILDDNILEVRRLYRGRRIPCDSAVALRVTEDFVDRYENVAVAGLNYQMFLTDDTPVPFRTNVHVYSCLLILNSLPQRWRGRYNEDTDLCLQVLASGWCTVLLNAFCANKMTTMTMKGGNTDQLYVGDGRLAMARSLERAWPGVVSVRRKYGRPQHHVNWGKFDTPLRPKPSLSIAKESNDYGMRLVQVRPKVKSKRLRRLLEEQKP